MNNAASAARRLGLDEHSGDLAVFHPGARQPFAYVAETGAAALDMIVSQAQAAFAQGPWRRMSSAGRAAVLRDFALGVEAEAESLALCDTLDMGRPISQTRADVHLLTTLIRGAAAEAEAQVDGVRLGQDGAIGVAARLPVGVVAAIAAWNYPMVVAGAKIAAPLAAGNCVILKPSELAPHSSMLLVAIARSAGLPNGVLTTVIGAGEAGRRLCAHPGVDLITFTGSTATGRDIMQTAAPTLKRLVLECGGKSAHLVFPGVADLDHVAQQIGSGILVNSGQLCVAGSRLLVHRSICQELIDRIAHHMGGRRGGDPFDRETELGPLASLRHASRVRTLISGALHAGATSVPVVAAVGDLGDAFVPPTLLQAVEPGHPIFRKEVFGPVLTVTPFADAAEARRLATATVYGLRATVWTGDLPRGLDLARDLEAGEIQVRSGARDEPDPLEMEMEPARQSGFGVEVGPGCIRTFTRACSIAATLRPEHPNGPRSAGRRSS